MCTRTDIHTYTHTHTHAHTHTCTHAHTRTHTYIHVYIICMNPNTTENDSCNKEGAVKAHTHARAPGTHARVHAHTYTQYEDGNI